MELATGEKARDPYWNKEKNKLVFFSLWNG